jgi:hypothetical protein
MVSLNSRPALISTGRGPIGSRANELASQQVRRSGRSSAKEKPCRAGPGALPSIAGGIPDPASSTLASAAVVQTRSRDGS